ncbi:uncharacterized protein At4g04775-like isoform X2 [Lycium ferocissimum]|uniref:uncharacterized protein At4g04775-like isoform X2 n=1 Tax=Lycium ferocissimum TaxID=112874 RepID=UPI00281662CE|nr:uncharacterized protein At4g04775-like isoform X2 [Lycium ferocissimum]
MYVEFCVVILVTLTPPSTFSRFLVNLSLTMSEISCNSTKKCRCGEIARCFTSKTPSNPGRIFYKCPKAKAENCGFWEWQDNFLDNALLEISDLKGKLEVATVKMDNLRESLNAVKLERDNLKKKVHNLEAINNSQVNKSRELEEKMFMISLAILVGFFCR